jgi:hypothetical protein
MNIETLRRLFDLDMETGDLRWKVRRCQQSNAVVGGIAGSIDRHGYRKVTVEGKYLLAHRIVFIIVHGYLPAQVDHINGKRDDNRPANLRPATPSENQRNARRPSTNTSGVKGVTWNKQRGKWKALAASDGKAKTIGYFDDLEEAAKQVRAFREQHHGEFARHG